MRKSLLGMVMLIASAASSASPLTPDTIRNDIHREGAKAVVDRLFKSGVYENAVLKHIESGNKRWVILAIPLSAGTDAATSEELAQSLIYALRKSPRAVLSVLDLTGSSVPRSPNSVCSASFFEGDQTDIPSYRAAAVRAIESVTTPVLQDAKQACLKHLRKE